MLNYVRPSIWYHCTVRYVRLVLIGGRKNINSSYFSESLIFTVHFVRAVYLETRHFQSLTTGKMWIRELLWTRQWKLKVVFGAVSDPAVCVLLAWRQVPVFTCWLNQNSWWRNNSSGATNRPIEDCCTTPCLGTFKTLSSLRGQRFQQLKLAFNYVAWGFLLLNQGSFINFSCNYIVPRTNTAMDFHTITYSL